MSAAGSSASTAPSSAHGGRHGLFVGTYTERLPHVDGHAPGIMRAGYAPRGQLGEATLATVLRNPSWIAICEGVLYAASETRSDDGEGDVSAYAIDPDSRALVLLGLRPSGGADPAHLAVSPDGRYLLVANYGSGSVALFALDDGTGRIGERLDLAVHEGEGPDPDRQDAPHPHMVGFDPLTGQVLVPDLGIDAVVVYDIADGSLRPAGRIGCAAGSGPRQLAFHPSGDVFFLTGELDNTLTVYRRGPDGFTATARVPALPEEAGAATGEAAAVRVSPSGELVFVSVRGHDSVSVFRFGTGDHLQPLGSVPTHGTCPRDITLTPEGDHLLVANQDSDSVSVFSVDEAAGRVNVLSFVRQQEVPSPASFAWAD